MATKNYAFDATGHPLALANGRVLFMDGADITDVTGTQYDYDEANDILTERVTTVAVALPAGAVCTQMLIADMQAAMAVGGPAQPARPPPVAFATSPYTANPGVIDLATKEGMALFKDVSTSLYTDSKKGFNMQQNGVFGFLTKIKDRAKLTGWGTLLDIPTATGVLALLDNYGAITEGEVKASGTTVNATDDRLKQNNAMLYNCVKSSLTSSAQQRVALQHKRTMDSNDEQSGIMLLKLVLSLANLETRATTNTLSTKLTSGMAQIVSNHGNNITAFNDEIRLIQAQLRERGAGANDILPQLFAAYESIGNGEGKLGRFVEMCHNAYTSGQVNYADITPMEAIEGKYKELVESNQIAPQINKAENDKIVALQAEIKELEASFKQGYKPDTDSSDAGGKQSARTQLRKLKPPKDGEPTIKIGAKTYHFCKGGTDKHQPKWVAHAPKDCKPRDQRKDANTDAEQPKSTVATPALSMMNRDGYTSDQE